MRLGPGLLLALLAVAFASDESCMGRCENGFDSEKRCQCDSMCKYYQSCCSDYEGVCGMTTRGDTFVFAEDDDDLMDSTPTPAAGHFLDESSSVGRRLSKPTPRPISIPAASATQDVPVTKPEITSAQEPLDIIPQRVSSTQDTPVSTTQKVLKVPVTQAAPVATTVPVTTIAVTTATTEATTTTTVTTTTQAPDPDADDCSGRPFDSFMQMKNGSMFAFRGDYFFELGQKSVLPGYPKLIKDVWGISGPIDAAFTRVNCQGKTYIFKGNKYWRFDDGVLDDDYPREINVGFDKIPDHVDAAFALPARANHAKEKVYFFKGDQYYLYEFLHQPSHEECIRMNQRSPSVLFRRYTDMYYSNYERFFSELFPDTPLGHGGHHFINKDWKGIKSPVDAVLAGRIYVAPWNQRPDQQWDQQRNQQYQQYQQYGQQWDQQYGQQSGRRRQSRSPSWESMAERGMGLGQGFAQRGMEIGLRLAERRMELEERLGRDWNRRNDQDQDHDRRRYDNGNYDSRDNRDDRAFWEFIRRGQPLQSVYFFKGDKYYRVDLKTKRVDPASPPYPRSIARYWLGCSNPAGQERK